MSAGIPSGQAPSPRQATLVDSIESRLNAVIARLVRTDEVINSVLDQVTGPRPSPINKPGFGPDGAVRNLTLFDHIDRLESISMDLETTLNRFNA
jgi:hypothetical protein